MGDDWTLRESKASGQCDHEAREILSKGKLTADERNWLISTYVNYRRTKSLQEFVPVVIEEYVLDQLEHFLTARETGFTIFEVKTGRHMHPFTKMLDDSAMIMFAFAQATPNEPRSHREVKNRYTALRDEWLVDHPEEDDVSDETLRQLAKKHFGLYGPKN